MKSNQSTEVLKCGSTSNLYLRVQINMFTMYSLTWVFCKMYDNGKLPVRNHNLSAWLRHIGVNCSYAQTEVFIRDPLIIAARQYPLRDMHNLSVERHAFKHSN